MIMTTGKKSYQSKTIIGAAIAILSGLAGMIGVVISEEEQVALTELVANAVPVIGGGLAWYGRVKATQVIK